MNGYKYYMNRLHLILPMLLIIGCLKNDELIISANFEVDGMIIRNGFVWSGWPSNIGTALDALKGMKNNKFDYEFSIYSVQYDSSRLVVYQIIEAVESAGKDFIVKNWTFEKTTEWLYFNLAFICIIFNQNQTLAYLKTKKMEFLQ